MGSGASKKKKKAEAAEAAAAAEEEASGAEGEAGTNDVEAIHPEDAGYGSENTGIDIDERDPDAPDDGEEQEPYTSNFSDPAERSPKHRHRGDSKAIKVRRLSPEEQEAADRAAEWAEPFTGEDEALHRHILSIAQPNFKPADEIQPDKWLYDRMKQRLDAYPQRKLNALLISEVSQTRGGPTADEDTRNLGAPKPDCYQYGAKNPKASLAMDQAYEDCPLPAADWKTSLHHGCTGYGVKVVPRIIIVTGFNGSGGNISVNGIYERYPDDFHNRPVYKKTLEKRPVEDQKLKEREATGMSWRSHSPRTRKVMKRYQVTTEVPAPDQTHDAAETTLAVPFGDYFLYFDDKIGCWCIGPYRGSREIYCKYPGVEDLTPDGLKGHWKSYDMGKKCWHQAKGLQTMKAGR